MSLNGPSNQQWYNDVKTVRKMMLDSGGACCPSCHMPFDKGKRRRLIDTCGHEICYSCVNSDHCPLCLLDESPQELENLRLPIQGSSGPQSNLPSRRRMKTNGHFTTYMQTREGSRMSPEKMLPRDAYSFNALSYPDNSEFLASPVVSRVPWQNKHHLRPNTMGIDSQATLSDDELSPPEDPVRSNMYMRLGLLLGDTAQSSRFGSANQSSQESYASISSLASSDANTTNTSPLSTLTGSSDMEPLPPLGGRHGASRDHSSDSVTSLMSTSTSTGHSSSTSPIGTTFRRQMFSRSSDTFNPFSKRNASGRRSNRGHNISIGGEVKDNGNLYKNPLKPLYFEVPQSEIDPLFLGREWVFREIDQELCSDSNTKQGVVIIGGPGSGKTAIAQHLVEFSCFGRRKDDTKYQDVQSTSDYISCSSSGLGVYQSVASLHQEAAVRSLSNNVVAYHFCQADNYVTCLVPEFVYSISNQLCQAPQLSSYREIISRDSRYQDLLSIQSCIADASLAFVRGVLDPLHSLRWKTGKSPGSICVLVIDGINEAEFHRPDYGDTIASFLLRHIQSFPNWLKVIITLRTSFIDIAKAFSFHHLSLDRLSTNENLQRDMHNYILHRVNSSPAIRANITVNNNMVEGSSHSRFAKHLASLSKGCMLYIKLTLDLVESGHLVVKSSSYRVLPVSLFEVYMLSFNLRFTTIKAYERVSPILQVCLASLYPLTPHEIFVTMNASRKECTLPWEDFVQRLDTLTRAPVLVIRKDRSVMFAHPSMREWLLRREENENPKFLCDSRVGHAMIAFRLSRVEVPLDSDRLSELGHHILKAHIYKATGRDLPSHCQSRHLQSIWVNHSAKDIRTALVSLRNVYSPNVKVSRLLLLSGASPDCWIPQLRNAPLLPLVAHQGFTEMLSLLLEFGADPNVTSDTMSALTLACQQGHLEIARLLIAKGAKINHVDNTGQCSLVHAAANGHLEVVSYLVQCDWPSDCGREPDLPNAAQHALVVSSGRGHTGVCEFLLDMPEVRIDNCDLYTDQTALTTTSLLGQPKVCEMLIKRGASLCATNKHGECPLACSAVAGHWKVTELLLKHQASLEDTDNYGRTPLMLAAMEGHPVIELLLSKGASTISTDKEGMTALCWACLKGKLQAVQCLIQHGANINHSDKRGRTPLDFAASNGDTYIVQLLLDKGAVVEHVDLEGMRPLDRAIGFRNKAAVIRFLHKGAKLGSQTWAMAEGKSEILLLLMKKLLEDGTALCNKGRLKEAVHRYQYALKKFPIDDSVGNDAPHFQQLKHQLYTGLSRCKRKMKELTAALEAADQAIKIKSKSFEGYYARARAYREIGNHDEALKDITEAVHLAPPNPDIQAILLRLKKEMSSTNNQIFSPMCQGIDGSSVIGLSSYGKVSGSTETIDHLCDYVLDIVADMANCRTKDKE